LLSTDGVQRITRVIARRQIGFVLIASWQAVIRGLRDENDNGAIVQIGTCEDRCARIECSPWLIDAHSGKGEDMSDDADPSKAMRGASAAAGAADYTLSLRYANGTFATKRRFSGKGRFVAFPTILLDFDPATSAYTVLDASDQVAAETTWQMITTTGALTDTPKSLLEIARACGLIDERTADRRAAK
jgi:hypothetical protein